MSYSYLPGVLEAEKLQEQKEAKLRMEKTIQRRKDWEKERDMLIYARDGYTATNTRYSPGYSYSVLYKLWVKHDKMGYHYRTYDYEDLTFKQILSNSPRPYPNGINGNR